MRRIFAGILIVLAAVGITAGGSFAYHLSQSSPVRLIVYMSPEHSPEFLKWSAKQAFYAFHPTDQEVEILNSEAGARYAATFPDPEQARAMLRHLLDHGVDINSVDTASGSGLTALHTTALSGNAEAVRLLLAHGASPQVEDNQGRTPMELIRAAQSNRPDADFDDVIEALESAT